MTAPTLTDLNSTAFYENDVSATPQLIDTDVTLTDVEGDMANGQLRVHGLAADDIISLFDEGVGPGQIGFNPATGEITFGGLLIGTASGGVGTDFTIAFNGDATLAAVEAVIEHLTYANTSDHPTAGRTLTIDVTDGAGQTTGSVTDYTPGVLPITLGGEDRQAGAMAAGDFDSDGDRDLVFISDAGALTFYENDGLGFALSADVQISLDTPLAPGSSIALGDMDFDGWADIVVVQPDGSLRIIQGLPPSSGFDGVFSENPSLASYLAGMLPLAAGSSLAVVDVNKDGFADLVMVDGSGQLSTLLNYIPYGAGYEPGWTSDRTATGRPSLGDFDGDGDLDLVIALEDGALTLGRNDGTGGFDFTAPNPFAGYASTAPDASAALDVNADGLLDLVVFDTDGFRVLLAPPPITNTLLLNIYDQPGEVAIAGLPASVTFEEDTVSAAPQLLFGDLTLTDTEQDLANSYLVITPQFADDRISIRDQGMGAGQVGFDGDQIYFGGVAIGQFQDIGGQWMITFSGASVAAIEAVLENLTYANTSNSPQPSQLTLDLMDLNYTPLGQYVVGLTINDNPEQMALSGLAGQQRIELGDTADLVALSNGVTLEDPEGDFDGSVFTVSGLEASDQVSLVPTADLTVSGGVVSYQGQAIGAISGGQGATFSVILNGAATTAAVQALIGALGFTSPGLAVGSHILTLSLTDQGGHALNAGGAPVSVEIVVYQQGDLTDLAPSLNLILAEAAAPHLLDSAVTVTGPGGSWSGAYLTVTGLVAGDVVGLAAGAFDVVNDKGSLYLFLNGEQIGQMVDNGSSFTVYFGGDATKASVEAVVEALTFSNAGATPDAARTLTLTLHDPAGLVSTDQIVVNIAGGVEYAMELSGFSTDLSVPLAYVNNGFVPLDSDVTLRDTNGDYAGSVLTVSGAAASDILGLSNQDPQVLFQDPGGDLIVNFTTVIGHAVGGMNGDPLVITFAAGVTTAQVEAVLESLALRTDDTAPEVSRTLTLSLQNGEGEALHRVGETGPVTLTFEIEIAAPQLNVTGIDFNGVLDENMLNSTGAFVMPSVSVLSSGGLPGGSLFVDGLPADFDIGVRSSGDVSYNSATGEVSYAGQVVAITGRSAAKFTLTFGNVTDSTVVQAVLKAVVLLNDNDNPTNDPYSLQVRLTSADGQAAGSGWKFTIQARGEQTDLSLTPAAATFGEQAVNAGPQALIADAVHNPLGEPVAGSVLTVGGLAAGDRVTLLNGEGLTFDEQTGDISVEGLVFAHAVVTEGVGLVVTFNNLANENVTAAVLKILAFSSNSDTPAATRTLTLSLVNVYGHPALLAGGVAPTLIVNVTPSHDQAVLGDLAAAVTFGEQAVNAAPQLLDADATFTAEDGVSSAVITVSGLLTEDSVTLLGDGALGFDKQTGDVTIGGQVVANLQLAGDGTVVIAVADTGEDRIGVVEAILRHLAYDNASDTPTASRTLTIAVADQPLGTPAADYQPAAPVTVTVNVTPHHDGPVVQGFASLVVGEGAVNAGFVTLDDAVTLYAPDTTSYAGGELALTSNDAADLFAVNTDSTGIVLGADVVIDGLQVASAWAVSAGAISFDLTADATAALVERLIEALQVRNADDTSDAGHQVTLSLSDSTGAGSTAIIDVTVVPEDDPTLLTGIGSVTLQESALQAGGQLLLPQISFTDVDEGAGAHIIIKNLPDEFVLSLRPQGDDEGVPNIRLNSMVSYGGASLLLISPGGQTGDIVVHLNGATVAQTQTFLSNLVLQDASDRPASPFYLQFEIVHSSGSFTVLHQVTVEQQFDPTTLTDIDLAPTFDEQAVNAGPQLLDADVTLTSIEFRQITGLTVSGLLAEDRVTLLGDAHLGWNSTTGDITLDGVLIGNATGGVGGDFNITVLGSNASVRLTRAEAILEHLAYANLSDTPAATRTLSIQVIEPPPAAGQYLDGGYVAPAPVSVTVNVTSFDDAYGPTSGGREPTLDGLSLQAFAGDVTLGDPDGGPVPVLAGAALTVSGLAAEERVSLITTLGAAGAVLQADGGVWVDGVLVGQAGGGQGADFVITFNAAATAARIETVIHQLGWATAAPQAGDHSLQLSLATPGGVGGLEIDFHVVPTPPPTMPTMQLFTGVPVASVHENAANAGFTAIDIGLNVNPDAVYANGSLRLQMSYVSATEAFSVINQGTGAGQIGYTKTGDNHTVTLGVTSVGGQHGVVTYQGVEIGTFVTDSAYDTNQRWADFQFNANATPQAVQALLHAIGFATSSDNPPELRQMLASLVTDPFLTEQASTAVQSGAVFNVTQLNTAPFYQSPNFVDVDADGDLDVLFVRDWDTVGLLKNVGTAQNPSFVLSAVTGLPQDALDGLPGQSEDGRSAMLAPVDLDADGDLDLVVGGVSGTIAYFENTGGPGTLTAFAARSGAANPFDGLDFNLSTEPQQTSPSLADLDGDGDLDMLVGTHDGHLRHYENTGTASAPVFTERHDFDAVSVASSAKPFLGDIDGDGDIDILVATTGTRLVTYENLGGGRFDATARFYAWTATGAGLQGYRFSTQTPLDQAVLTDLNGDGVAELYTADYLQYFRLLTNGTATIAPWQVVQLNFFVINEPEYIYGTPGDDTINGDARGTVILGYGGADIIDGKAGADVIYGGAGNDIYLVDALDTVVELDGEGTDTVKATFSYVLGDFVENLTLLGAGALNGTGNDLNNTLVGTAASNVLTGLGGADILNAGTGADVLDGGDGDDNLQGGLGADLMRGGLGNDLYHVETLGDVTDETGGGGLDTVQSSINWTLAAGLDNLILIGTAATLDGTGNDLANTLTGTANVNTLLGLEGDDILKGMAGEDVLIGGDGKDLLDGGLGADAMIGGLGDDIYIIDNLDDFAVEIGGGGIDTIQSKISLVMGLGIENLVFTANGALDATGNAVNNLITGNLSSNRLSGMGGDDTLIGAAGGDTLDGGDGADILDGGASNDILSGGAGIDTLIGGDGADSLDGGAGIDQMDGGLGNDTYVVDSTGDVIVDAGGVELVNSTVAYVLADHLENLTLIGSGDIAGQGNGGINLLTGNGGANLLSGEGGIDTLGGMAGDDALLGGLGIDTLLGGDGADVLQGGGDSDKLTGGLGADRFLFTAQDVRLSGAGLLADRDAVLDLTFAEGDILDLSAIDANSLLAGDQAFAFAARFTKVAGQATLKYGAGITTLELDSDGDGKADLRVTLTGDHTLTGGNLYTGAGDTNGGWLL